MKSWDENHVRARISEKSARDPERQRFGAATHRYELGPRLPEGEILAFEVTHGIRLPQAYRSFVAEVGDGPAGPFHGLMPLTTPRPEARGPRAMDGMDGMDDTDAVDAVDDTDDDQWAVDDEWEDDRLPGRLTEPFPLSGPLPGPIGASADALTRGTLTLAELGCGIHHRLVLNGPRAGEVWQIDADWGGFVPVNPGFRTWYADWLEER
ncbi:SMI1/KNR4 family protein [Streptomyces sp. NPDC008125]|uniref:SMI1/KNR4 family protein n=1 Tax=Streptomyces sp. NPDC008125 TaxID=3364811 RepID=UPI0036E08139